LLTFIITGSELIRRFLTVGGIQYPSQSGSIFQQGSRGGLQRVFEWGWGLKPG
jgi:hypothetical protein